MKPNSTKKHNKARSKSPWFSLRQKYVGLEFCRKDRMLVGILG